MSSPIEKKTVVFFNEDYKEMMAKQIGRQKERSLSCSDISSTREDDDDNCSTSVTATLLTASVVESECSVSISPSFEFGKSFSKSEEISTTQQSNSFSPFTALRLKYLSVNLVVMLADGLQGGLC